ncbi:MAG: hypothetical protein ACKVKG_09880 [Alphaproteobacteria bacterium]|jgi:hypothetical protein
MPAWNSRVLLSIIGAITGMILTYAFISIGGLPVVQEHTLSSKISAGIGLSCVIYGWLRIFYWQRQNMIAAQSS